MKKFINLSLLLLTLTFSSCNTNNSLVGKKYYVLDGKIDYSTYYASLKEIQLEFLTNDKLGARMTFYADANGYNIIDSSTTSGAMKIYSYKYDKGFLELPVLNLLVKTEFLENGDIKANGGDEYLYATSIVSLIGTDSAYARVKQDSKGNSGEVFKDFFNKTSQPAIKIEGDKITFVPQKKEIGENGIRLEKKETLVKDMFTFCSERSNKCYEVVPSKVDIEIFNFGETAPIFVGELDDKGAIELNEDGSIVDHRRDYEINDDVKLSFKFYGDTLYQLNENGNWDKFSPQGHLKD